ncbi:MAG: diguanylate cyclase [Lysobacteraceae bacterium]
MSPDTARKRQLRYAAFGLALGVLVAVGGATIWTLRQAAASFGWVEHTYQVIAATHQYRAALLGAEAAARGYRLTGNPAQRREFEIDTRVAQGELQALAGLTPDQPVQVGRVRALRALTADWLRLNQAMIDGRGSHHAVAPLVSDGLRVTARIEATASAILRTERGLLAERRERSAMHARWLVAFCAGGSAFALLLLGLLMRNLAQEIRRTRQLEREARDGAIRLEASLAELRQVAEQRAALGRYASLLQGCAHAGEALRVTGQVVAELLPRVGGRCYLLRASQDLAETAIVFGEARLPSTDLLHPSDCWALRRGLAHRLDDPRTGIACAHVDVADAVPGAWSLCLPLLAQGTPLGLLHVSGDATTHRDQAQALLAHVAEQLGLALVNLQLRDKLRAQSLRDPLTGLHNRRYLDEALPREVNRCLRRHLPLAVLMLDVDHFKSFNDAHGHAAGDALLAAIARVLQDSVRGEDLVCRYGGEEFTVVLAEAARDDALQRAEQIRAAVALVTVQHLRQTLGPRTVSIGLAMLPAQGETPEALLHAADHALYRAKSEGRDRVVPA